MGGWVQINGGSTRDFFLSFHCSLSKQVNYPSTVVVSAPVPVPIALIMKQELYLLGAVVLLIMQPAWCLSECDVYDHPREEKMARCAEVVDVLESALVSSKVNLHILRDAFLSGSYPPPSLLGVIYNINKVALDTSKKVEVHWSGSRVFTMIDPTMIHALQPDIMMLIYYLEGISFLQTIELHLNVSTEEYFSESEYDYAIMTITERVS